MDCRDIKVIKKDGTEEAFHVQKVVTAVNKSAERVMVSFTEEELEKIRLRIETELNAACFAADKAMGIEKVVPGTTARQKKYHK